MQPFKNYIPDFVQLLQNVNASAISNNAYAQEYLQILLNHKLHYLRIYATVLEKAFAARNNTQVALLDFGTGNGLLALFAKFCGVQKVYASDVNQAFLEAAQTLSNQLNLPIEGWILGDESSLANYFQNQTLDIVIGTDVIEHVYNLDTLFNTFNQINKKIITVFTTASVAENPIKSKQLKKLQLKDELEDSNAFQATDNNPFAGMSFLEIRKKLIENFAPNLQENLVVQLAIKTRGLNKIDIEKAITNYTNSNIEPTVLKHKTNTCDPITGSWTERLLTVAEYREIHLRHDKNLLVHLGFYNSAEKGVKSLLASLLNTIISILGNAGIMISPFIILEGLPKKTHYLP